MRARRCEVRRLEREGLDIDGGEIFSESWAEGRSGGGIR